MITCSEWVAAEMKTRQARYNGRDVHIVICAQDIWNAAIAAYQKDQEAQRNVEESRD